MQRVNSSCYSSEVRPLDALTGFMSFHAAWILTGWAIDGSRWLLIPAALTALFAALSLVRRTFAAGALAAFVGALVYVAPDVPNHAFLVAYVLAISFAPAADRGMIALAAIVFFWAGVQKLLAGTWTQGQMLAFVVAHEERFRAALGWLTREGELERWRSSGVYLASAPLAIVGWAVVLSEIAIAIAIAIPRTRKVAAVVGIAMSFSFAIVARELTFAMALAALLAFIAWPRALAVSWPFAAAALWSLIFVSRLLGGGLH